MANDFATRYDEVTGTPRTYALREVEHSGYDTEYLITVTYNGQKETESVILSLWSAEAYKLAELIKG